MGASPRVSIDQVREALVRWEGNMSATARELGIARNNLYKRIVRSGLDVDAIRAAGCGKTDRHGKTTEPAPRARPVRLVAAHRALLREAKFDLQHKLRRELDEDDILATFIEEAFGAWLRAKLL